MTKTTNTSEQLTDLQKQAIDKFQKEYFDTNKLIFNLTLDQYHAIINVMAEAKISQGFYVVRDLLAVGDPQKDAVINSWNQALEAFKLNGFKAQKPRVRVKAVKSTQTRKTA